MAIKMYSSTWCPDCYRAKRFLKANNIDFEEIKIDSDEEAARAVMRHNQGRKQVPTFEIEGSFYGNPPLDKLARLLGVKP